MKDTAINDARRLLSRADQMLRDAEQVAATMVNDHAKERDVMESIDYAEQLTESALASMRTTRAQILAQHEARKR
jgi:hypothetical protein